MQIVHRAADIAEAHVLRQLLEGEGIFAHIQGEFLRGGIGELPVNTEVLLQVPDEDVARARGIIADWQASDPHDEAFADEDDDAARADDAGAQRGSGAAQVVAGIAARDAQLRESLGVRVLQWTVLFSFGVMLGWGLHQGAEVAPQGDTASDGADLDRDGRNDQWTYWENGRAVRIETDRNRDGEVDEVTEHGADGTPTQWRTDDDFDRHFESRLRLRDGLPLLAAYDFDGDGRDDLREDFVHGVVAQREWLDAQGRVSKRMTYRAGLPDRDALDSDGDGTLDLARRYDARGEIVETRSLR
jgi:hypothetical protein